MKKQMLWTMVVSMGCWMGVSALSARAELPQIEARQVAVNADERDDGDDEIGNLEMVLTNDKGQERIRKVVAYRKDYGKDTKMVMFFKEPADVKDAAFLSWNYDDSSKDDDQWLYLPAAKKTRRISGSNKKDYFMGTDFTFDDMGKRSVDDYTYTMLGQETIDGTECYHIEMLPKDESIIKKTGYGRGELWVRGDIWMPIKAKFFDKKLEFIKELTVSDIQQEDNIWTAHTMKMVNDKEKHTTVFKFSDIKHNTGLSDDLFSERQLTKGAN